MESKQLSYWKEGTRVDKSRYYQKQLFCVDWPGLSLYDELWIVLSLMLEQMKEGEDQVEQYTKEGWDDES